MPNEIQNEDAAVGTSVEHHEKTHRSALSIILVSTAILTAILIFAVITLIGNSVAMALGLTVGILAIPLCVIAYFLFENRFREQHAAYLLFEKLDEQTKRIETKLAEAEAVLNSIDRKTTLQALPPGSAGEQTVIRATRILRAVRLRMDEVFEIAQDGSTSSLAEAEQLLESPIPIPTDSVSALLTAERLTDISPQELLGALDTLAGELRMVETDQRAAWNQG